MSKRMRALESRMQQVQEEHKLIHARSATHPTKSHAQPQPTTSNLEAVGSSPTLEDFTSAIHSATIVETRPAATSIPPSMSAASRQIPLFICSLGNPGPAYADTLHSAGHTVLNSLAAYLHCSPFIRERAWDKALVTHTPDNEWTLYQSPTYMNVCGKPIRNAYRSWLSNVSGGEGRLVVVHDELEKPLGKVSIRGVEGKGTSAKGHNGLKSLMQVFGPGGVEFVRIGVGIGRPEGRGSKEVGDYVLRKMSPGEKRRVEGSVSEVVDVLRKLERG